jgi:SulP family sulfate permease
MILQRLRLFNTFFDSRWEDLTRDTWMQTTYRDFSAGLIVALTAIPMAMGFAMAMGLRPEQGIIAGALACAVGRTWGGSKYQVYGPTAAFIPLIAGLVAKYGEAGGGTLQQAHGFLVLVSIIAGVILMLMGLFGLGKYAKLVPNSIVVGFTVGIAAVIALTNVEDILGLENFKDLLGQDEDITGGILHNLTVAYSNLNMINGWSVLIGLGTFVLTKFLLRISIFIPAPLIAIATSTLVSATLLADKGIIVVGNIYGSIPNHFFVFTPPVLPAMTSGVIVDIVYFTLAIVFVSGVESLLCSSMADRLADNRKTPFNPDKEFWGQGLVQIIVPLVNGFPCTGALARTATSIKAGAVTPLAGYFKAVLKLALAYYIASYLELVPMACIGGILLWVASNMFKPAEIKEVLNHNKFHAGLMIYTAVMVPMTDFLTGVLSALVLYAVLFKFLDKPVKHEEERLAEITAESQKIIAAPGQFNCVTVPLAMTDEDAELLHYAAKLAAREITQEFHFIHVIPPQKQPMQPKQEASIKQRIREEVEKYFDTPIAGLKFNFHVMSGASRLDKLIEYTVTSGSDLILLGHRKSRTGQRSLGRRLAMVTKASVWMVPEHTGRDIKQIIVPIDFSKPSADCLSEATALAKLHGLSEITAVHVYFDESTVRYEEHISEVKWHEVHAFEEFLATIDTHGITVKPDFVESSIPANAILRRANELKADLIVMSTRGHSNAVTILLGSVTSQVMADSPIPVIAIKHFGNQLGLFDTLIANRFWERSDLKTS